MHVIESDSVNNDTDDDDILMVTGNRRSEEINSTAAVITAFFIMLPHSVQLGNFSPAEILQVFNLQVGPRSGIIF